MYDHYCKNQIQSLHFSISFFFFYFMSWGCSSPRSKTEQYSPNKYQVATAYRRSLLRRTDLRVFKKLWCCETVWSVVWMKPRGKNPKCTACPPLPIYHTPRQLTAPKNLIPLICMPNLSRTVPAFSIFVNTKL